jgi:hypothetical protein
MTNDPTTTKAAATPVSPTVIEEADWRDEHRALAESDDQTRKPSAGELAIALRGMRQAAERDTAGWQRPQQISRELDSGDLSRALVLLACAGIIERAIIQDTEATVCYRLARQLAADEAPTATRGQLDTQRARRFEAVLAYHEADGPDPSTPGAASGPVRYALLSEHESSRSPFLNWAASREDAETMVASDLPLGWNAVCLYDLDELAGEQPPIQAGDIVRYQRRDLNVISCCQDGEGRRLLWLDMDPNVAFDDCEVSELDAEQATVIAAAGGDERLPCAYKVAETRTITIFAPDAER